MMDRLSDLPDSVLQKILSLVENMTEVVRTSVLSPRWRFLWKSVPLSLRFSLDDSNCSGDGDIDDFVKYVNRQVLLSRSFQDIRKFSVNMRFNECYRQDIDLWVYFAKAANVEDFILTLYYVVKHDYEFPQFGYMNSSLKNMVLRDCQLNPTGSISWSSLISLSIGDLKLTDGVMEKVLSGCPNLESLEIDKFSGLNHLEISSVKVRKLIVGSSKIEGTKAGHLLEIFAPYVQNLQLLGSRHETPLQLRNVASLVTAFLDFTPYVGLYRADDDGVDRECSYLKELLQSLVHVKSLELGPWCIEDFPAICSLLQSSPDLETLVIDWTKNNSRHFLLRFIDEDENGRMFEKHIFDCLLFHLRTVKIINYYGPLRANKYIMPLVKHLLKNAEVLEKMVIAASLRYNKFEGSDVSRDFVEMAQELLSFPRSSKHAVVLFSY